MASGTVRIREQSVQIGLSALTAPHYVADKFHFGDVAAAAGRAAESLARSRETLEKIAGAAFPGSFSAKDALLAGTGRRAPTDAEKAELGDLAARIPFVLG